MNLSMVIPLVQLKVPLLISIVLPGAARLIAAWTSAAVPFVLQWPVARSPKYKTALIIGLIF
jgi:hypothetical protein